MSGFEVIAAITSIIALVEFSQKVLARAAELHASGNDVGDAFQSINDLLPPISHAVKRTKERIDKKEIDEETCTALVPIHRGVERTLRELETVLKKYTPKEGASKAEILWKFRKSVFQEKKIKGILQTLHEYVGVLTLSHAEAANAGTFSPTDKDNIQRILANVAQSNTTQAASLPRKCRNLLSLDGGGLRGLSILYILEDLMAKVNEHQDPPLKPCEVFDLIGGSGTGGLISIMLGRLGMTVEDCIAAYLQLFERLSAKNDETAGAEYSSSQIIKSNILRTTVSELIEAQGLPAESKLRNNDNISCYTLVCATVQSNSTIVHFQNYILPGSPDRRPATIVDAACATLSSAEIFEAVQFGKPPSKYIAGELGANNPIDRVWNEAQHIWSKKGGLEQLVSCVVSVGAGTPRTGAIDTEGLGFTRTLQAIEMQTEETAKQFLRGNPDLGGRDKRYHRFNVHGLNELGWEGYSESGSIKEDTFNYLEFHVQEVEQCAELLQRDIVPSNVQQIQKYYKVPPKLVNNFVGREEILSKIDDYFLTTVVSKPKVLILHALGGQGKSQIALKYCQRSEESHQGIFWVNASSETKTRDAFGSISNALDGPSLGEGGDLEQKIQHVRNTLGNWRTPWILVFDNYDWPGEFTIENMRKYIPTSEHGKIIITSRYQNLGRLGKLFEVPAMTRDEGLKLLLCEPNMLQADKDEGARIVDRLGGLALAIDQAAAYIEWKRIAIKDFLPAYEVKRQNILDYTPDFGWEYSTMQVHGQAEKDKALSAFTTWDMSFQQLIPNDPQRQESAAHFLTLHAFLDYLNVAEDLFRTFWEAEESPPEWLKIFVKSTEEDSDSDGSVEDDSSSYEDSLARAHSSSGQSRRPFRRIDTIQSGTQSRSQDSRTKNSWKSEMFQDLRAKCLRLSLLRVQSDDGQPNRHHQMFSLHPLIRDWLQLRAKKNQRRRYCQEAIGIVLVSINSFGNQSTTADQKQALLAHMDACISNDKRFSKTRRTLGYDHSDTASIFGNMYRDQGRLKEAEELEVQVIETRKKVLGAEHPDTLTSMANLASTFWNQGRWKEAEELDVQVMETRKRVLGAEHPGTLTSMANLASTYRNQGRWKEAEELEVQVMETSNRVLGAEHPDTLTSMGNLASTFWNQGRWKEAEELEVQVMETSNMVLGAEHPDTLTSMNNLAHTWKGHGRDTEALKLMEECLIVRIRILGTNHYSALSSRTTLLGWQTEELEIVASADKDLDV